MIFTLLGINDILLHAYHLITKLFCTTQNHVKDKEDNISTFLTHINLAIVFSLSRNIRRNIY